MVCFSFVKFREPDDFGFFPRLKSALVLLNNMIDRVSGGGFV